jgi:hypothetical protein
MDRGDPVNGRGHALCQCGEALDLLLGLFVLQHALEVFHGCPLRVVDYACSVDAAVDTDGDESGLDLHHLIRNGFQKLYEFLLFLWFYIVHVDERHQGLRGVDLRDGFLCHCAYLTGHQMPDFCKQDEIAEGSVTSRCGDHRFAWDRDVTWRAGYLVLEADGKISRTRTLFREEIGTASVNAGGNVYTAFVVMTVVTAAMNLWASYVDFAGAAWVIENMERYGIPRRALFWLGMLKLLGAVGLVVGLWAPGIGLAAAFGLCLYFVGALMTVMRAGWYSHIRYPAAFLLPAAVTFGLSMTAAWQ